MKLNPVEQSIVGGLLAVVTFLQLETHISHTLHIVFAAIAIFLGTVGVKGTGENSENVKDEPAPGTEGIKVTSPSEIPQDGDDSEPK